ncbi:MAG: substrate-binding domain-containing protein [Spirochaetales bacterium]|nr:substrate-binding domain-containing protein [Spirochaetales bacterium]
MAKKSITMQDIADRLNVSKVTVSKALSDREGVGEVLKKQIVEAAESMGYHLNSTARSLRLGRSRNIGVIIPKRFSWESNYYSDLYQKISLHLSRKGYSSTLHILEDEDERSLVIPLEHFEYKVDGLLVLGQISREYIEKIRTTDTPVVFTDFYDEHRDVDSIITDNFYESYNMTNFIISKNHKKIAFVGSVCATSSIMDRYLGYVKSLMEHAIPMRADYLIEDRDAAGRLIEYPLPQDMPTAFVCNCDLVAFNLIQRLVKGGLSVPRDVSVSGFDNDMHSKLCTPPITTVDSNSEEMARVATEVIINRIENDGGVLGRIVVKGHHVIKESVAESQAYFD